MKLLFDQNISFKVLKHLPSVFRNSSHVKSENLLDKFDKEIWDYAKANEFTIVTQDSDFNDLNILLGYPPKVIWIRTGNVSNEVMQEIIKKYANEIESFIKNAKYGCFEIFSIKKTP